MPVDSLQTKPAYAVDLRGRRIRKAQVPARLSINDDLGRGGKPRERDIGFREDQLEQSNAEAVHPASRSRC